MIRKKNSFSWPRKLYDKARIGDENKLVEQYGLKNKREILSLFQALPPVVVASQAELLHFIDRRSLAGAGVGFVDAHLLASAELTDVSLWTLDAPLRRLAAKFDISYID